MSREQLLARRAELEKELARAQAAFEQLKQAMYQLQGGIIQLDALIQETPPKEE